MKELAKKMEELERRLKELEDKFEKLNDNPPLKFEEIQNASRIWDNVSKYYTNVHSTKVEPDGKKILSIDLDYCTCDIVFEEGRYYKKEVEK